MCIVGSIKGKYLSIRLFILFKLLNMFSEKRLKGKKIDNICVLFPFEIAWGKNNPVAQVSRIEWLFENYNGNVTIIEPLY